MYEEKCSYFSLFLGVVLVILLFIVAFKPIQVEISTKLAKSSNSPCIPDGHQGDCFSSSKAKSRVPIPEPYSPYRSCFANLHGKWYNSNACLPTQSYTDQDYMASNVVA